MWNKQSPVLRWARNGGNRAKLRRRGLKGKRSKKQTTGGGGNREMVFITFSQRRPHRVNRKEKDHLREVATGNCNSQGS